jgi:hypothetical protein
VKFDESKQWNWQINAIEDNSSSKRIIDCVDFDTGSTSKHSNEDDEGEIDNQETTSDTPVEEVPDSEESNDEEELGRRVTRRPVYLDDFVTNENYKISQDLQNLAVFSPSEDPITYDEAAKHDVWRKAMDAEIAAIESNNTWELTALPASAKKIGVKWIYKTKYNEQGKIEKHKARLVAKGYSQQYGIDYNEVFAPVARWDTIRSILAIAAVNNWYVFQLDVKSAFLHGELNEEVYVEQPLGYQRERKELVYRLKMSLYGLRQAPRA